MRCPAILVIVALLTAACGSDGAAVPTAPPSPNVTVSPPSFTDISVGQEVQGTLVGHGSLNRFDLTASSTGTLVVKVVWERPALIAFGVGTRWVAQTSTSPLVARIGVTPGEKYQLTVADGAPWDYGDFVVPYVLITMIEAPGPGLW